MKAQQLRRIREIQETLPGVEKLSIEPMPAGSWALMADHQPLVAGDLRQVILAGEQEAARNPRLRIDADQLLPQGIKGYLIRDHFTDRGAARGVYREAIEFRNASDLYLFLRTGDFQFWSPAFIRREDSRQVRVYRSHDTVDSMTAWEIVLHRLENDGQLPDFLEVPAGTCPQCLSRFVVMPMSGSGYHCLECHYATED